MVASVRQGLGSSLPIGATVFVPYKTDPSGTDDTNLLPFAEYPTNFINPKGQILESSEYGTLKDLLKASRVFTREGRMANLFSPRSWAEHTGRYLVALWRGTGPSDSMGVFSYDIAAGTAFSEATAPPSADNRATIVSHEIAFTTSNLAGLSSSISSNGGDVPSFTPFVLDLTSNTFLTGDINETVHVGKAQMHSIGATLQLVLTYCDAALGAPQVTVYQRSGSSWISSGTWDPSSSDINNIIATKLDVTDGTSIIVGQSLDVGKYFDIQGGSGSSAYARVSSLDANNMPENVELFVNRSSGFARSGTGYLEGELVTIDNGNGGTASLRVETTDTDGGIRAVSLESSSGNWDGQLGIFTCPSNGVFELRQKLDATSYSNLTFNNYSRMEIRKIEGVWYLLTAGKLYRSTSKINWTEVSMPEKGLGYNISLGPDGTVLSQLGNTYGYWSNDGETWEEGDTFSLDSTLPSSGDLYMGETVEAVAAASYLYTNGDILDYLTEFQIPTVPDPGADGVGAGIYPLMRIK